MSAGVSAPMGWSDGADAADSAVVGPVEAGRFARAVRKESRLVVLTNGCFDMLHDGHIRLLREARKQGDLLILVLNSDASVRALKGPGRPIFSQESRAHALQRTGLVDLIVPFDDLTADRLIEAVRPDVYVKGADYSEVTLPEAETAKACGARLYFVPLLADVSTSRAICEAMSRDGTDTAERKPSCGRKGGSKWPSR